MFGCNFTDYLQSWASMSLPSSIPGGTWTALCSATSFEWRVSCASLRSWKWLIQGRSEERKDIINRMRSISTAFIANMLERRSNQPYMLVEYGLLLGASVLNCFFIHRLITIGWGAAEMKWNGKNIRNLLLFFHTYFSSLLTTERTNQSVLSKQIKPVSYFDK